MTTTPRWPGSEPSRWPCPRLGRRRRTGVARASPFVAVPAAIVGNVVSMAVLVILADRVRARGTRDRIPTELTPRRQKIKQRFDRYGVAGVNLLGQAVLPSQITSAAIVSFGAPATR